MPDREHDALSLPEVAKRLGKSRWTMRRIANATGEVLPGVRVFRLGGSDCVSRIQLDEYLRGPGEHTSGYSPGLVEPMSPEMQW